MDPNDVAIRTVRRGDEILIQEVFDGMSPEARYHRFLQATPVLTAGMRRLLADVDGRRHQAWSAHVGERPVGISRIITDQTGDLELSVAVIDGMQRRGIGRQLVTTALDAAGRSGRRDVMVLIHPENRASVSLFRGMGAGFRYEFGLLVGRVPAATAQEVAA
jgi:acetyltransferase